MSTILFALWATVVLCNCYVGYMQVQLFNKGLVHTRWNLGTSILNAALQQAKSIGDVRRINSAKIVYRISVMAFIPFLILAFWEMWN
jgi:hypothetical protein